MSSSWSPIEMPPPLGEALEYAGLIDRPTLSWALARQRETGERLGAILVNRGIVHRLDLQRVLGAIWGIPFVDLMTTPPDPALARRCDPEQLLREGWFPVESDGTRVVVGTCEPPSGELMAAVREVLGAHLRVELRTTTPLDVERAVTAAFHDDVVRRSTAALRQSRPDQSAASGLTWRQRIAFAALGVLALLGIASATYWAAGVIVLLAGVVILGAIGFRVVLIRGGRTSSAPPVERPPPARADRDLPTYTVLVPVYREATTIGELIASLGRFDYPAEKLEVLVLLESDDTETIAAAQAARPPSTVRLVVVPDAAPKTKGKACNVGLFLARGEFLAIYDVQERPAPDQLRRAVAAFDAGGPSLGCLQARPRFWNASRNLLTRLDGIEFDHWHGGVLPGMARRGLPFPLAGASHHFRVATLKALGGWDPHNVSSHASLGLRMPAEGHRVGVLDSPTETEACTPLRAWIRQRSRWMKGYLQTALVHTRHPLGLVRDVGLRGAAGYLLLVAGAPLALLLAPVLWIGIAAWYLFGVPHAEMGDSGAFWLAALLVFAAANALLVLAFAGAAVRERGWRWAPYALAAPVFFALQSFATWRALIQLVRDPYRWEHTPRGEEAAPAPVVAPVAASVRRQPPVEDVERAAR